jgi:hypothetical protein
MTSLPESQTVNAPTGITEPVAEKQSKRRRMTRTADPETAPRVNYSPGGVDFETGTVYEQIVYRSEMVYARSDSPDKLESSFKDYMGTTYSALPGPVPWKLPQDPLDYRDEAYLYNAVKGFLTLYLYFSDPVYYEVVAAWILSTWRIEEWRASGPLYLLGPINSGKTTVIEVLEELAFRGIRGGSMSTATMFRLADLYTPALLIDESQIYNREEWAEAQALINERYRPGGKVWRMTGEGRSMIPQAFKSWGATALASSHAPWEALGSRSLLIRMEKGKPERHTGTADFFVEASRLRSQLLSYRFAKLETQPKLDYPEAPPDPIGTLLEKVQDERTKEVGYPLVTVADPECRNSLVEYLIRLEEEHQAIEESSDLAAYVIAISKATPASGKVSVEDVKVELAKLWALWDEEKGRVTDAKQMPSSKWVSKTLQTLGFKPTRMPQTGRTGVLLDPDLLARLKLRYRTASLSSPDSPASPEEAKVSEGSEESEGSEANRKGRNCEVCGKLGTPVVRLNDPTPRCFCSVHLPQYKGDL